MAALIQISAEKEKQKYNFDISLVTKVIKERFWAKLEAIIKLFYGLKRKLTVSNNLVDANIFKERPIRIDYFKLTRTRKKEN